MNDLPAPLVLPEVDLRDFAFMPLDVVRLRDSDLAAKESPEACWSAVLLWAASWHQIPAASLPDDDQVLANLAGFGRVVKEWLKIKDGALRGWIKCSDGRLYHKVIAEKAVEAWRGKQERQWRTECARLKKHCQRHGTPYQPPEFEQWLFDGCPQGQAFIVTRDKHELSQGQKADVPDLSLGKSTPQGQGERQGQGQGQPISSSLRSEDAGTDKPRRVPREPKSEITLAQYLTECKAKAVKAVPDDHHIRAFARDAGISDEMLQVAWLTFRDRHIPERGDKKPAKRQKDWPGTFANAVKDNWYRLWFIDGSEVKWTSQGQIQQKVYETRLAEHNAHQPEEAPV